MATLGLGLDLLDFESAVVAFLLNHWPIVWPFLEKYFLPPLLALVVDLGRL